VPHLLADRFRSLPQVTTVKEGGRFLLAFAKLTSRPMLQLSRPRMLNRKPLTPPNYGRRPRNLPNCPLPSLPRSTSSAMVNFRKTLPNN